MKLRHQMFLFSTAQLVVFGALFATALWAFERSVLPMFHGLLRDKSENVARLVSGELDVALGADDRALMASSLEAIERDPDFRYVVVRDARGNLVFAHGTRPVEDPFAAFPYTAVSRTNGIQTWAPVSLEGLWLGEVAIVFSTARLDELDRWAKRLAVGVTLLWLLAVGYSIVFARAFVTPIRAMMDFTRDVAGGALSKRLDGDPPGELRELRDYLNEMTADLERREHERQLAAARAEEMQGELLAMSRMAGMAEIATGVLHNVGNVLNSLNVSVSVIGDQVRDSRVASLTRSIKLYDDFPGGLPAFLDTDKGKLLPAFLSSMSKRLAEENAAVLTELASVTRNVDHIKSIVAMQQSYAHPTGITENVDLAALIEDALGMGESSFAKHGIEVVREFTQGVMIVTDRHKLLQILINLISNARHALVDNSPSIHRLTVGVRTTPTGVAITIGDNGVGIPAGHLEKIFQHGFTTKDGGHGFGLHASANAARALGGQIKVTSAGPGCGATFVVELPRIAGVPPRDFDRAPLASASVVR